MAHNSLAPGFFKLSYAVSIPPLSIEHTATIPCKPASTGGGAWEVERNGGVINITAADAIEGYVNVAKALMSDDVTFLYAELWLQADGTSDPVFAELYELGVAGTNTDPTRLINQITCSSRTSTGGQARQYLMSPAILANLNYLPPDYDLGGVKAWADYISSDITWICGRDNGFVTSVKRARTKTNDVLRRRFGS